MDNQPSLCPECNSPLDRSKSVCQRCLADSINALSEQKPVIESPVGETISEGNIRLATEDTGPIHFPDRFY